MQRMVRGLVACVAATLLVVGGAGAANATPPPPQCTFGWPSGDCRVPPPVDR